MSLILLPGAADAPRPRVGFGARLRRGGPRPTACYAGRPPPVPPPRAPGPRVLLRRPGAAQNLGASVAGKRAMWYNKINCEEFSCTGRTGHEKRHRRPRVPRVFAPRAVRRPEEGSKAGRAAQSGGEGDGAKKRPARPAPKTPARESAPDALGALAARSRAIGGAAAAQREEIERQSREALADLERIRKELASDEVLSLAQPQPSAPAPGGAQAAEAYGGAKLEAARFAALEQTLARPGAGPERVPARAVRGAAPPVRDGRTAGRAAGCVRRVRPRGHGQGAEPCVRRRGPRAGRRVRKRRGGVGRPCAVPYPERGKAVFAGRVRRAEPPGRPAGVHECPPLHAGLLSVLGELFSQGSCALPGRYLAQNGRLVDASGALAANAVGEVRVRGKYLVLLADRSPTSSPSASARRSSPRWATCA